MTQKRAQGIAEKEAKRLFRKAVRFWKSKGHAINDQWEKATASERECFLLIATESQARAVRVVKAEIKRVKLDQHYYRDAEKIMVTTVLERILAALQRGR